MSKVIKVKEWIITKAQQTAGSYNCFIDYAERDEHTEAPTVDADGFLTVIAEEVIKETEKAVQVRLQTGDIVGSMKGWTLWIPKSQMISL